MSESWESVFGEVPESFSLRVGESLSALPEKGNKIRHLHRRPMAAVAAAAAAILLLGGTAFATDLFGLRSIRVADVYKVDPDDTRDIVALQGCADSDEYRAAAEWMDYLASLTEEERLHFVTGGDDDALPERYYLFYACNSPEMRQALDAIVEKYGLALHESMEFFSDLKSFSALSGVPVSLADNAPVFAGYIYEDGTFHADIRTRFQEAFWDCQLMCARKGSFNDVTLGLGDAGAYEEWSYTTASGVEVQLALSAEHSVILADLPSSFVSVNLLAGSEIRPISLSNETGTPGLSRTDLEQFAELFDLSLLG